MDNNTIKEFNSQWERVQNTVISTVHRNINRGRPDMADINNSLFRQCEEWFNGNLAPSLWFDRLKETDPAKAEAFEKQARNMHIDYVPYKAPSAWWIYIVAAVVAVIAYFCVDFLSDWKQYVKIIIAIGCGILSYYIGLPAISRRKSAYQKDYVDKYAAQLENYGRELAETLSR